MAATFSKEIAYSYRHYTAVMIWAGGGGEDPTDRVLAQIEKLLVDAGDAYRSRHYLDAIDIYEHARSVMWSQIQPTLPYEDRVRDLDLLTPFASTGAEWLNVLAVEEPVAGVRPREGIVADNSPALGLRSAAIDPKAAAAVADLHTAETLEARGNATAAAFFKQRATAAAPDLVNAIGLTDGVRDRAAPATGIGRIALTRTALSEVAAAHAGTFVAAPHVFTPPVVVTIPPQLTVDDRTYSFRSNGSVKKLGWQSGAALSAAEVLDTVYEGRKTLDELPDILTAPQRPADVAVALAHSWHYESVLGLAECHHAMGNWAAAEEWYLKAAEYQYLNAEIEAPYVWGRLADLYLDWGDSLFRVDEVDEAKKVYQKVLRTNGTEANSELYTIAGLKPGADAARNVLANLDDVDSVTASPLIAAPIFSIWGQLQKIAGDLDFWGHWAPNVPIWTFDYLQSVAVNFCNLAISAERDAMTFWEKADQGQLSRLQLVQNLAQSRAERAAAQAQLDASAAETAAFAAAKATADLRATNAQKSADEYRSKSWQWTMHQALSAQLAGGEDGSGKELNALADRMMQGGYSIEGERGTLSAAEQLAASRLQREYEIHSLERQRDELVKAAAQADAERKAAQARQGAAQASLNAATVRVAGAEQFLAAFDDQRFTPDVWHALGERMSGLSNRYLMMGLDVAKRMQRSYNFENDVQRAVIKTDYSAGSVHGFLAADTLLADVQSFTYDLVTSTAPKPQAVRQTISLAERYPFLFETQLRRTGTIEFQTMLDDFDGRYPGTYAGRIERVEVEVDGIIPPRGVSGTLTNAGISQYRLPASAGGNDTVKQRIQADETLILSDLDLRTDALLVDDDRRLRRIFEGAGVATSWTLSLPPDVNDLDLNSVTDVRLTFTYEARYDPDLRESVLAELASRPQANERQRPLPLRWLYPDAFFSFYDTGVLSVSVEQADFPRNQTGLEVVGLSLIVVTTPRSAAEEITLRVAAPGQTSPTEVKTAADGTVDAEDLEDAIGRPVVGDWTVEVRAADNPDLVDNGTLVLDAIDNIALIIGYSFTPRA